MKTNKGPSSGPLKIPPAERLASSFKQLALSSTSLNSAVGELCENISPLNKALNGLNLGVSAWHKIAGHEDQEGSFWSRDIGYTKVGQIWGIALRRTSGNGTWGTYDEEVWLFPDAPRWMQIESVGKIPDLFDELIKRTEDTIGKIKAKTVEATDLANAINDPFDAEVSW
jgi:hypothetical protein